MSFAEMTAVLVFVLCVLGTVMEALNLLSPRPLPPPLRLVFPKPTAGVSRMALDRDSA